MTNVVIAGYARSPFHFAGKGELARVRADDLCAQVIRELIVRTKVKPEDIEDIVVGCAFPEGEQGLNVARMIGLLADLPLQVGGMTINRFCGSSMSSVHNAVGQIAIGAGEVFIAAGVESMSRVPMGGYNPLPNPELARTSAAYMSMGETAENVARRYQIPRAVQEAFAVRSQKLASEAQAGGRLDAEIVPIKTKAGVVSKDGCIRPGTTAEALAGLKPAFDKEGSVTAGTSSPLTDGASAVLVCSEDYARAHGLDILARIKSVGVAGCAPDVMGLGPIGASKKALDRAGVTRRPAERGGAERGLRQPGAGLRPGARPERRHHKPGRRGHCARPSAGRHRRADRRQGGVPAQARGRPVCAGHPVHRRRPGHRHRARGGLTHG